MGLVEDIKPVTDPTENIMEATQNAQVPMDYNTTMAALGDLDKTRETLVARKRAIEVEVSKLGNESKKIDELLAKIGRPAARRPTPEESAARAEMIRKALKAAQKTAKGAASMSEIMASLPEGHGLESTTVAAVVRKMIEKGEAKHVGERRNTRYELVQKS